MKIGSGHRWRRCGEHLTGDVGVCVGCRGRRGVAVVDDRERGMTTDCDGGGATVECSAAVAVEAKQPCSLYIGTSSAAFFWRERLEHLQQPRQTSVAP